MQITMIPIDRIVEDSGQPRTQTDEETLQELAASIRQHGILNPITVMPLHNVGMYRIVTGERRWRAARMAGLSQVPCIIRELDEEQVRVQQLIENMQREDLAPLDRARGILALQEATGLGVRDVAAMLGLSERMVRNLLDLLDLPRDIGEQLVAGQSRPSEGQLTEKHARAIKQLADQPDVQRRIAERVRQDRLSSAETAELVRAIRLNPEDAEEILTAPPEAFRGYLRAKEEAAQLRQQAAEAAQREEEALSTVRACLTALRHINVQTLAPSARRSLGGALSELRQVVVELADACKET